jgi:small subunit ribosomal protein S14
MAKTNMLMREKKRLKIAKKFAKRRAELKELIRDPKTGQEAREAAQVALQKQPRDAGATRQRNRCSITGRSRGVYRKFGLSAHQAARGCQSRRDSRPVEGELVRRAQ